jgi:hypothetical protein
LEVPGWIFENPCLRWSPDGKGLQSLVTRDGITNIWEQPLAGGKPKQLSKFTSGLIFDFTVLFLHAIARLPGRKRECGPERPYRGRINTGELRVKAFQILFREDGSLFINFPYFRYRIGADTISNCYYY